MKSRAPDPKPDSYTCFDGDRRLGRGTLAAIALLVKHAAERGAAGPVLIFDDATGRSVDVNLRGSDEEVTARLASSATESGSDAARGRGRPKLGVVSREVTLLPRHWEWLAAQPGGASVALRKLVDAARRTHRDKDQIRRSPERAYHFMSAMAGDRPGFEEAARAMFAGKQPVFVQLTAHWPADIRNHAVWLAFSIT